MFGNGLQPYFLVTPANPWEIITSNGITKNNNFRYFQCEKTTTPTNIRTMSMFNCMHARDCIYVPKKEYVIIFKQNGSENMSSKKKSISQWQLLYLLEVFNKRELAIKKQLGNFATKTKITHAINYLKQS